MKHERWMRLQRESEALQAWARTPIKTEYAPNGSNYHDHLCTCPGCVPGDPDPTDEEILEMAWQDLQAVPSYVEQQARAWVAELNLEVSC